MYLKSKSPTLQLWGCYDPVMFNQYRFASAFHFYYSLHTSDIFQYCTSRGLQVVIVTYFHHQMVIEDSSEFVCMFLMRKKKSVSLLGLVSLSQFLI